MSSEVQICNRALIKLHATLITSLTEESEEAVFCNSLYPQVRDEVLRMHFWNFAVKQATLQQLVGTPKFDFQYKYQLPSDYVRIYRMENSRQRYKIKGQELHTDLTSVDIEYIAKVTDPTKFDPMFSNAVSLRLAAELAYAIAGSESRGQSLLAEFEQYMKKAKRADGQEGTPDKLTADLFVNSRHEYGTSGNLDWTRI